jgi:membrane protease YdiL (CAAX protease family)
MIMKNNQLTTRDWIERTVLALLFISICGAAMVVFKPWGKQYFEGANNYLWRIGFSAALLVAAWLVHGSRRFEKYWQIIFAFFILSVAISMDWVFGRFLFDSLNMNDHNIAGWVLPKLNDCLVIVSVVIVLTLVTGGSLESIYLQKGNLKLGLTIGLIAFFIAVAGSIPTASMLFKAQGLTIARILPWVPGLLLIVLANGALEEILFRGLFLRKLEPFFGKFISNSLVALVFTVLHKGSTYTSDQYLFLVILVPLALLWGYIMQKTDSVWGSIIFHAGMDIPIFLGIFSNLK